MKRVFKNIIVFLVLIGMIFVLIGQTVTAEEEPIVLKMVSAMWLPGEIANTNRIVKEWNETRDDIKVELTQISWPEYRSRMATSVATGDLPDLIFNSEYLAYEWFGRGVFTDLNKIASKEQIAQYHPKAIDSCSTVDGELTMIVTQWGANGHLIYNKNLFEQAGIQAPEMEGWTYEEEKEALQKLTTEDTYGMTFRYTQSAKVGEKTLPDIWQHGDKFVYYDEEEEGWRVDIGEGTLWAFNHMKEYIDLGIIPEGVMATTTDSQLAGFLDGKYAIVREGSWFGRLVEDSKPDFEWGIMHPTRAKEITAPQYQTVGYSITEACKHKEEAMEFLIYFTTGENGARYAADTWLCPATLENFDNPRFKDAKYAPILAAVEHGHKMPSAAATSLISETILPEIAHWCLAGRITPEEAVVTLRQEVTNALKTYGDW